MAKFLAFEPKKNIQDVINIDELISYTIKYSDNSTSYCGIITFKFSNNTEFIKRCDTSEELLSIIHALEKYFIAL